MFFAIFICALAVTAVQAQPDDGCSTEILALARTADLEAEAVCTLLGNYENCISQIVDDAERSNLEADLQSKQQQHSHCVGAPLSATVRTASDAIEFTGRDFTFHRTTRQSLNLYALRDQVASFSGSISTTSSSIVEIENSIEVMASDGGEQLSTITAVSTSVATLQRSLSTSVGLLEAAISSSTSAANANDGYTCVPGLEFDAGNGVCQYLNYTCDTYPEHYQRSRETRTSDRTCAPKTRCNSSAWEVTPGSGFTDRICRAVTNCTARELFTAVEATRTSDASCIRMPGLTEGSPVASCRALLDVEGAESGYYYVSFGSRVLQTWCDMETDGGGWTAVARGNGNERSCWTSGSDCRVQLLGEAGAATGFSGTAGLYKGATCRMGDSLINSLTYTMIRFQGTDAVRTNVYFRGKNHNGGGCTYRHWNMATGHCNCASNYVDMRSRRCGNNYHTHKGAGDWPNGGGGMHTAHTGGWWYIKTGFAHNPYCNANSHRQATCDIMLWVR
jgi:hypothetical protein